MSVGALSNESKILLVTQRLANVPFNGANAKMGLSTNNITPTKANVLADLTSGEPGVAGYARQTLTGWTVPVLTGDDHAISFADPVTFLNTSGGDTGTVFCWFFVDTANGKMLMAGRFVAPFILSATVGSFTTTPFWQGTGE